MAGSWLIEAAQKPDALNAIGGASEGWPLLMRNEAAKALAAFEADLKAGAEGQAAVDLKIGAARAALELAEAHQHLADIVHKAAPKLIKAQMALPGAATATPWARYIQARMSAYGVLGGEKGGSLDLTAQPGSPADPWLAALKADAVGPLADLLAGRAGGADSDAPAGAEDAYVERLRLRSLIAAERLTEARKRMARINPATPDIRVKLDNQQLTFIDPFSLLAQGQVYAAVALKHLEGVEGPGVLLKAKALMILGRYEEAAKAAQVAAGGTAAPLSMLIFSGVMAEADLVAEAKALEAVAFHALGQEAAAKAAFDSIPEGSIAQKISRQLAAVIMGQALDAEAFPSDRRHVTRLIQASLPKDAPGSQVVGDLMLIDRYVDVIQRRFADALQRTGKRAVATRVRADAEEKSKAQSPSMRNTLSALTAAALDNVQIGQPRVAVKYLNRMREHLPAVMTPMEMLRDVLTLRAINQDGTPTRGN